MVSWPDLRRGEGAGGPGPRPPSTEGPTKPIDISDVIFEVPKCSKIKIFRGPGLRPDPTGWELTGRAYIAPLDLLDGDEGTRCPSSITQFQIVEPAIRPRFCRSQGLTHDKAVIILP